MKGVHFASYTLTEIGRTSDFITVTYDFSPSLDQTKVLVNRSHLGGDAIAVGGTTVIAYGFLGTAYVQYHPNPDSAILTSHTICVTYSTDEGATWSALDSVHLDDVPGFDTYRTIWMWDDAGSPYTTAGDIVLDSLGYPHVVIGLQQKPTGKGQNVVFAEIYKDDTGWNGKIISEGNPVTEYSQGLLDQNGYAPFIARNQEGTFFAVQFTNSNHPNNNADLWLTGRYWRAKHWRSLVNIAHFAPRLKRDGDSLFTAFSAYALPSDLECPDCSPNRTYIMASTNQLDLSPLTYDYYVKRITAPPDSAVFSFSVPFSISTVVANVGEESQTDSFVVRCVVYNSLLQEVFTDSVRAAGLAYQDSVSLVFPHQFLPPDTGWYTLRVWMEGDQYSPNDSASIIVQVIYPSSVPVSFPEQGNLISVPLLRPRMHYNDLYADIVDGTVYRFASGYQSVETLKVGEGYWAMFPSSVGYTLRGYGYDSIDIPVTVGWNLIGSIGTDVPVSSITSEPPGVVTSQFFGYRKGYVQSDTMVPGQAYWVKVNQVGTLTLSAFSPSNLSQAIKIVPTSERPPLPPEVSEEKPTVFALEQNYPNPFTPNTLIRYQLL